MTKTTKAHFNLFKSEVEYWHKRFGLIGYDIFFKHEDCGTNISTCSTSANNRCATFKLNINFDDTILVLGDKVIRETALHETLHLLLGEMACLAISRFVQEDELDRAEEGAVNVLVKELIKLREDR